MNEQMQYAIIYSLTFIFIVINLYLVFAEEGMSRLTHIITTILLIFYLTRARFIWPQMFFGKT